MDVLLWRSVSGALEFSVTVQSLKNFYPLGVFPCSGLRLLALREFQVFLACSACATNAASYHSCSAFSWAAPVLKFGASLLAFGSNYSSQPTAYGGG